MILFSRLFVLLQRNDDVASYFTYELGRNSFVQR